MSGNMGEDLFNALLGAFHGDDVPNGFVELIAAGAGGASGVLQEGKLALGFQIGSNAPFLMTSSEAGASPWREAVGARWPSSEAFFAEHTEADQYLLRSDGSSSVVMVTCREPQPGVDGQREMGAVLNLDDGTTGRLTSHESAPMEYLSGNMAERVSALVDKGAEGFWMLRWHDNSVVESMWVATNPDRNGMENVVSELGTPPFWQDVRDILSRHGARVNLYVVHDGPENRSVAAWIWWSTPRDEHLPSVFEGDRTPTLGELSDLLGAMFLDEERSAAVELFQDVVYPKMTVGVSGTPREREKLAKLWRGLTETFASVPPFERLAILAEVGRYSELQALQTESLQLAVTRYLATHPDTEVPTGESSIPLPDRLQGASVEDVVSEATESKARFDQLVAWHDEATGLEWLSSDNDKLDNEAVQANLEVTLSGSYTAAWGPLHDWLQLLGPLGYDDDAALGELEGIDLEADPVDKAVAKALLDDDS